MIQRQQHKYFPWFTTLFAMLLIGVYTFMAFLSGNQEVELELLEWFGAPYATQIFLGKFYGIFFNNFIHLNFFHLVINICGLWLFGGFVERRIGWFKMAFFGLVCSLFGSLIQLAFSDDAGVGVGASIFGFVGLIISMAFQDERFRMKFVYWYAALIAASLVFFILNNQFMNASVGVESKLAGFIWGFFMGFIQRDSSLNFRRMLILLAPFALSFVTLIYAPWSSQWQCARGITLHQEQKLARAERHYRAAIAINKNNALAKENLTLIRIQRLSNLAYKAHQNGEYSNARRYYLRILALNKTNAWAISNLKNLP